MQPVNFSCASIKTIVLSAAYVLSGCTATTPQNQSNPSISAGPPPTLKCETQIKYQGSTIKATGIEIPFGASSTVKIATVDYDPKSIREVSSALTLLDQMQYAACQQAQLASSSTTRDTVVLEYQRNLATYLRIVTALRDGDKEVATKESANALAAPQPKK